MRTMDELAMQVKEKLNEEIGRGEISLLKEGEDYILTIEQEKCVCGYYHLNDYMDLIDSKAIADSIMRDYESYQIEMAIRFMSDNLIELRNYEYASQYIFCRLKPRSLIKDIDMPHIKWRSIIICFYICIKDYNGRLIEVAITDDLLKELEWENITPDKLYKIGKINQLRVNGFQAEEFEENIIKITGKLANTYILFPEKLERICNRFKVDKVNIFLYDENEIYIFPENGMVPSLIKIVSTKEECKKSSMPQFYIFEKS